MIDPNIVAAGAAAAGLFAAEFVKGAAGEASVEPHP